MKVEIEAKRGPTHHGPKPSKPAEKPTQKPSGVTSIKVPQKKA